MQITKIVALFLGVAAAVQLKDDSDPNGGNVDKTADWWNRPFSLTGWGAEELLVSMHASQTSGVDGSSATTPGISFFTKSVVDTALSCGGTPKRAKIKLPENDPDISLLRALTTQRRTERDSLQRHSLSLKICRLRRRVVLPVDGKY